MKRPIGVITSCVVLGLLATLFLVFAAFSGAAALILSGDLNAAPDAPNPMIGVTIGLACAALWMIATLIGLWHLRVAARYSILMLSCFLLGLVICSIRLTIEHASFSRAASTTNPNAYTMHQVLLFEALASIIPSALGGWWLVYFNLPSTKVYFLAGYSTDETR